MKAGLKQDPLPEAERDLHVALGSEAIGVGEFAFIAVCRAGQKTWNGSFWS